MNPLSKYISTTTQSTGTEESRRSKRGGCKYPFPQRLFDLLQDIDVRKPEQSSILSWHPNGKYFQVHNRNAFERVIQKKYFNQSKYASFRRQLNLWGFERINPYHTTPTEEDEQDFSSCYFHPLFQRHDMRLCCTMARVVGKDGSRLRSVSQDGSTEDDNTYHNKKENQVEEDIQESSTPFAVCSSMSTAPSSLDAPQDTGDNEVMVKGEEMLVRSEEHQLLQRQDFHSDEDMTEEQQQQ
ncbi:hypothetical protein CTEN210_03552 [Chaetoceros tenuissimus]|uniref:HSF-type DNA-binding domain-containing protein n=1 Tax=Chaetoceros tenuissimus TaxID=426638 RepID=A0AAD3CJ88_9STRA|nr:hypothetical protein CTEN210_03552 [Chaetoceros tenuissimus]